jgi:Uma2 family endonuclease
MSPAPTRRHQDVVVELSRQIATFLRSHTCRVYTAPFAARLPRGGEADDLVESVVQPGISVICDQEKLDDAGCRGAPDRIIEVLSPGRRPRNKLKNASFISATV